jgi:hypothetical protein
MDKWQRAIIKPAHSKGRDPDSPENWFELPFWKKVVRVTIAGHFATHQLIKDYRDAGCDGLRFYRVHPEDFDMTDGITDLTLVLCEHCVLTD